MIYLDNTSTTPVLPEVLEVMLPCFAESFGNASSLHGCGRRALSHLKHARKQVAALLKCHPAEVIFTSGGIEGNNIALKGMMSDAGDGGFRLGLDCPRRRAEGRGQDVVEYFHERIKPNDKVLGEWVLVPLEIHREGFSAAEAIDLSHGNAQTPHRENHPELCGGL